MSKINSKGPEVCLDWETIRMPIRTNCWFTIINPIDGKMHISIGNHDDVSSTLLNQYLSHFRLSKRSYSFNYGNAHFFALSTEMSSSSTQYDFAKADLQKASQNSNIHWIIVFFHKPMYTSPGVIQQIQQCAPSITHYSINTMSTLFCMGTTISMRGPTL